jgi:hypothetical protein
LCADDRTIKSNSIHVLLFAILNVLQNVLIIVVLGTIITFILLYVIFMVRTYYLCKDSVYIKFVRYNLKISHCCVAMFEVCDLLQTIFLASFVRCL